MTLGTRTLGFPAASLNGADVSSQKKRTAVKNCNLLLARPGNQDECPNTHKTPPEVDVESCRNELQHKHRNQVKSERWTAVGLGVH